MAPIFRETSNTYAGRGQPLQEDTITVGRSIGRLVGAIIIKRNKNTRMVNGNSNSNSNRMNCENIYNNDNNKY